MMKTAVAAGLALVATGFAARAAEPTGWKFEVTPMAWLAGIEGDVTVNGNEADFDKSFSDMLDYVEFAGGLLTTVQKDRFLLWVQLDFMSLSTDELDVEDQPKGGTLDSKMFLGEAAVGYQVDGWMENQTFDILVGVRTLQIENELDIKGVGDFKRDNDLVDPMLILRPSIPVFPSKIDGLRFNPTMAIGAGGDADLVYELQPQLQYEVSDTFAVRFGYRRVGYKFKGDKNDDNELNISLAGLIVGAGFKF